MLMNVYVKRFTKTDDLGRPVIPTIDDWDNAETEVVSLAPYTEMKLSPNGKTIFVPSGQSVRKPLYVFDKEASIAVEVEICPVCQLLFMESQTARVPLKEPNRSVKGNFCHNCCTVEHLDIELIEHVQKRGLRSVDYNTGDLYKLMLKIHNDLTKATFVIDKDNVVTVSGYRKIKILSRYEEVTQ